MLTAQACIGASNRLTAYRQRTTPLIEGKVTYVSPDAMADRQTGAAYYLMHVQLTAARWSGPGPWNCSRGWAPRHTCTRTIERRSSSSSSRY